MPEFKRIAIADRSRLSHNIYEMILKPLGFSLFSFRTLRELKEKLKALLDCHAFLINSNTFGNHFERHYRWLQTVSNGEAIEKIFLCNKGDKEIRKALKKLKRSHLVEKPFYPPELGKLLEGIFGK